jgi:hypothetical protein
MISMTFTGPLLQRKLSFFTIHDRAKIRRVDSEEFRFVPRTGPSVWWQADCARGAIALLRQGEFTMSEQAVEERGGWASDIMWVALYSILVLLAMLLWI